MSRSNPVVPMLLLAGACLIAVEAEAKCGNPNECLCLYGATAVVRAQPETPWIVDVKEVLRDDEMCPVSVGDEIELHQLMDPEYEVPNRGLAGSGDPVSTHTPSADAGSGDIAVRPDLPTDHDIIVGVDCGRLYSYLLLAEERATCPPAVGEPYPVYPRFSVEDAKAVNASENCRTEVDILRPPPPCNDTGRTGCSSANGTASSVLMLMIPLLIAMRRRRANPSREQ